MSVILDALKKTENKQKKDWNYIVQEKEPASKNTNTNPIITALPKKRSVFIPLSVTMVGIMSISVFFLSKDINILNYKKTRKPEIKQSKQLVTPANIIYNDQQTIDAFQKLNESSSPTQEPKADFPDLQVTGIIWSTSGPTALINNQSLSEGNTIKGAFIEKIEKDNVTFLYKDKQHTVRMR